ncbi:MAG TPA: response regulator [Armatimonadetes bacterium]|nr:response regulator [Armatimonadota bacterium]
MQRTILIVEDDLDVVESLKLILEGKGFNVIHALDKESGLELARDAKPDLIILDIMMPSGTEGFHFVWALRKEPDKAVRDIPIIVISSIHHTTELRFYPHQRDAVYEPGEYLPVQAFLDKPVDPDDLLRTLSNVLGDKRDV